MNCKLIRLTKEYENQLIEMIDEWKDYNDTHICNKSPGAIFRNDCHDFDNYLKLLDYVEPNSGLIPSTTFFCLDVDRNILVGASNIRHYLNKGLYDEGGHIGDGVRPSERKKGYASEIIRLSLIEAKKLGIKRCLITANTENVGSVKSITNNGGIFCDEIIDSDGLPLKRFWFDLDVLNEVGSKVILRDLTNEDIADRINWLTNFIEWQRDWDGPWRVAGKFV